LAKGPEAFRTISEAADELGVPQHVLRFWETRFSFIRPMKRAGGRRFYRPQDILVLRGVQRLLHDEGYTIKGVQRLHREEGMRRLLGAAQGEKPPAHAPVPEDDDLGIPDAPAVITAPGDQREALAATLEALEAAKVELDRVLSRR
jgi:DNA-binding transcriptional MerR regulator